MQLGLIVDPSVLESRSEIDAYGGDFAFLRARHRISLDARAVVAVDLFSGAGGLSLGAEVAAAQVGRGFKTLLGFESNLAAAAVFRANFSADVFTNDIRTFFRPPSFRISREERDSAREPVDVLLAGPPCQGHSDLNNYTRRHDLRNELYLTVSRAAKVYSPTHIIIENVPTARHDKLRVVERTRAALEELGYHTTELILDAKDFGVAQTRKRHFNIASRHVLTNFAANIAALRHEPRTLRWAIEDLEELADSRSIFDAPGETKATNRGRIAYLFENDLYDLPDHARPECHRGGSHSYKSVYGRLHWDRPAQTITRGFHSISMGRYVHPSKPRTITAHEAARIQFIPDFFSFASVTSRSALCDMIGNAVPPKLAFVVSQALLAIGS